MGLIRILQFEEIQLCNLISFLLHSIVVFVGMHQNSTFEKLAQIQLQFLFGDQLNMIHNDFA